MQSGYVHNNLIFIDYTASVLSENILPIQAESDKHATQLIHQMQD